MDFNPETSVGLKCKTRKEIDAYIRRRNVHWFQGAKSSFIDSNNYTDPIKSDIDIKRPTGVRVLPSKKIEE